MRNLNKVNILIHIIIFDHNCPIATEYIAIFSFDKAIPVEGRDVLIENGICDCIEKTFVKMSITMVDMDEFYGMR